MKVQPITDNPRSRQQARDAADAIRRAIADPSTAGERGTVHLHMSRPRRGVWLHTWANLPGLMMDVGQRSCTHTLLPGWSYTAAEMKTEMIEDLDRYADTGELPQGET